MAVSIILNVTRANNAATIKQASLIVFDGISSYRTLSSSVEKLLFLLHWFFLTE